MAASKKAVREVAQLIRYYVHPILLIALVRELIQIDGNESFITTIKLLAKELLIPAKEE